MPLMKEAMSKADFDRKEQGLPPIKVVKDKLPEPEKPSVNEITMDDIPKGCKISLEKGSKNNTRNREGMLFIGYDVEIACTKKGTAKTIKGWMNEGSFMEFVRTYRSEINLHIIKW